MDKTSFWNQGSNQYTCIYLWELQQIFSEPIFLCVLPAFATAFSLYIKMGTGGKASSRIGFWKFLANMTYFYREKEKLYLFGWQGFIPHQSFWNCPNKAETF